jgi:hypothetical protein
MILIHDSNNARDGHQIDRSLETCVNGIVLVHFTPISTRYSQSSNSFQQNVQCSIAYHIKISLKHPGKIALHAQWHIHASSVALFQPGIVLPLSSRLLCICNNLAWYAAHGGAVHTKTAFRNAVFQFVREDDGPGSFVNLYSHALVLDLRMQLELFCERAIVGCEEANTAHTCSKVVEHSLRDCDTIVRGCATAKIR